MTTATEATAQIYWLTIYSPDTGAATKVVGSLVVRDDDFAVLLNPTANADPWRDLDRTSATEYLTDSNGQTRGVIEAVVDTKTQTDSYNLLQLAALSNLAAIGHGAT